MALALSRASRNEKLSQIPCECNIKEAKNKMTKRFRVSKLFPGQCAVALLAFCIGCPGSRAADFKRFPKHPARSGGIATAILACQRNAFR